LVAKLSLLGKSYVWRWSIRPDEPTANPTLGIAELAVRANCPTRDLSCETLGLPAMPKPADAAQRVRDDLKPCPALSVVRNGPEPFEERTVGKLLSDGVPADLVDGLMNAVKKAEANLEIVASKIAGVRTNDGGMVAVQQTISGGPSVLFDAVAVLFSEDAVSQLVRDPAARHFVSDAYSHCTFIAYNGGALDLIKGVLGDRNLDAGSSK
jgi:catalase